MPTDPSPKGPRFLLGQLSANGDCLYATAVARQIKADHPNCHLTWAIGTSCRRLLEGNPYVDEVWEFPPLALETSDQTWRRFAPEARRRKRRGEFDQVYLTQISPDHYYRSDGGIRSTIFRGYPGPITVPVAPVLRLSEGEKDNVRRFAERHGLAKYRHVILFECSPKSAQSRVNPEFAMRASQALVKAHPDLCVILSSNRAVSSSRAEILDASGLTLRENAELAKHCSLLIGCSSGITWVCTSEAAKPLPMIQLLGAEYEMSASVVNDFERWSLPTKTVLEMLEWDEDRLVRCVGTVLSLGAQEAKLRFGQPVPPSSASYPRLFRILLQRREYKQAVLLFLHSLWKRSTRARALLDSPRILRDLAFTRLRKVVFLLARQHTGP